MCFDNVIPFMYNITILKKREVRQMKLVNPSLLVSYSNEELRQYIEEQKEILNNYLQYYTDEENNLISQNLTESVINSLLPLSPMFDKIKKVEYNLRIAENLIKQYDDNRYINGLVKTKKTLLEKKKKPLLISKVKSTSNQNNTKIG